MNNQAAQSYVNAGVNTANAIGNLANAYIGYKGNTTVAAPIKSATTTTNAPKTWQDVQKSLSTYGNSGTLAQRTLGGQVYNKGAFKMPNFASGTQGLMESLRKYGNSGTLAQRYNKNALFGN